ncbi:btgC [Candida oxycetoniae]|uniref:glucan endo-1,3-beta-D-glucosidase n=1 Tax=Candida oxycetoniae TaxID=497107 RepID=A0AAI9SZ35_9ASCO|nr:btgC [Candida oxycetoniae]KAI3405584.2 btgC [Candida oxycetoniae]
MRRSRPISKRAATMSNVYASDAIEPSDKAGKDERKSSAAETEKSNNPYKLTRSNSVHVFMEYGSGGAKDENEGNDKEREEGVTPPPLDYSRQRNTSRAQGGNDRQNSAQDGNHRQNSAQNLPSSKKSYDDESSAKRGTGIIKERPLSRRSNRLSSRGDQATTNSRDELVRTTSHPSIERISTPRSYRQSIKQIIIPSTIDNENVQTPDSREMKENASENSLSPGALLPFNTNNDFEHDLKFTDEDCKTGGSRRDATVIFKKKETSGSEGTARNSNYNKEPVKPGKIIRINNNNNDSDNNNNNNDNNDNNNNNNNNDNNNNNNNNDNNNKIFNNYKDSTDYNIIDDVQGWGDATTEKITTDHSTEGEQEKIGYDIYDSGHRTPLEYHDYGSFTSPTPRRKCFDLCSRKSFIITIVTLIMVVVLLLGSSVPVMYILSKGTQESVDKYFQDPKHKSFLNELYHKYIVQKNAKESVFGASTNSVEGLSAETKGDTEVVELMSVVSNVLFNGIAYSPMNAMEPFCGFSRRDAMLDLAKLSTVTTKIRTYGMQCKQVELILDAIDHMNLNMTVAMGVWIGPNNTVNKQQMDMMKKVIAAHPDPSRVINSIYIGNEVLFREDKSKEELIAYIRDAKSFLELMHVSNIPVGTSEIGSLIDSKLLEACDIIGANIHPFFGGVSVEEATSWTLQFLDYQIQPYNEKFATPIVITEIGWPSGGGRYKQAIANVDNVKYFIRDFLCTLRETAIDYYFFEGFDEPWKEIFWEANQKWETQWGIFNKDRSNKFPLQYMGCT